MQSFKKGGSFKLNQLVESGLSEKQYVSLATTAAAAVASTTTSAPKSSGDDFFSTNSTTRHNDRGCGGGGDSKRQPRLNWFTYDTGENEDDLTQEEDTRIANSPGAMDISKYDDPAQIRVNRDSESLASDLSKSTAATDNNTIYKHVAEFNVADKSTRYRIGIFFLHQNARSKTFFWNRLASLWTGSQIIHVEIYFEHDRTSCSVSSNCPVSFKRNKIYSYAHTKKEWECVTLSTDAQTYDDVYQFCRREQGEPFDANSIYCFPFVPCFMDSGDQRGWICSRLVVAAFKSASIFPVEYDEKVFTPASVLKSLLALTDAKKREYALQHFTIVP